MPNNTARQLLRGNWTECRLLIWAEGILSGWEVENEDFVNKLPKIAVQ
jgi:hypothetical protein